LNTEISYFLNIWLLKYHQKQNIPIEKLDLFSSYCQGTNKRTQRELENLGADLNAYTSRE